VDLQGWIDAYLDHLRVERALAKNTLDAYSRDLNALAAHVGGEADPKTIGAEALASLMVANVSRGFGARSSARQLSGLRGFFRFLVRERAVPEDPDDARRPAEARQQAAPRPLVRRSGAAPRRARSRDRSRHGATRPCST
jgi:site-specific recombinase XerD